MTTSRPLPGSSPVPRLRQGLPGLLLFVVSVVLSAAMLFAIQPMITRIVLPHFGGSAAVWSVAMVFFQASLLAGYAYAHLLARLVPVRLVPLVHIAVLAAGLVFLPPRPVFGSSATGEESLRLLGLLALTIGVPFAALSANAPLLQFCFSRSGLPGARNPYPLYAASNAGSLGVLVAYPTLLEPFLTLRQQALLWSVGYWAFLALFCVVALLLRRAPAAPHPAGRGLAQYAPAERVRWLGLSLVPSGALVAVTAHLSTDIAAAPFLWVAPLALYLGTFIIAFGARGTGWLPAVGRALAAMLVTLALLLSFEIRTTPLLDVVLHLTGFFLLALYCHGRLAALRPEPERLTGFYLALSLGGVIGGAMAALAAPLVFKFVAEYPLLLALGALALPGYGKALAPLLLGILLAGQFAGADGKKRETRRSFYGVHTIETTADGRFRTLRHGIEVHGAQRLVEDDGRPATGTPKPLTYYTEESPLSEAIDAAREKAGGGPIRIGVVGLGAGSIACLAELTDTLRFYEIDPEVIRIARDPAKFRFLTACAPASEIVIGDARRTLEMSKATHDILILDAFSSDSIPIHLLTREALAGYLERLAPGGMLVLHLSNNHLRLQEVVAATAQSLGLHVRIHDEDADPAAPALTIQPTVAVLVRQPAHLGALATNDEWQSPAGRLPRAWTDDYSDPLGAFLAKLGER